MKTLITTTLFILANVLTGNSQSLTFTNPTLKSGTDLKKGAVYLFKNVTTNVNAEVTITDLVNNATVNKIDDNGGGVGYLDAFQPEIKTGNKGESYAVFTIKFYEKTSGSLYLLQSLQATALDIDGTSELKEFDDINIGGGIATFVNNTPELTLKPILDLPTLTYSFRADNKTGSDKNGVDTSAKNNMFTVTNVNVNTMVLKLGANTTTTNNIARQYSIYMKGFLYPNTVALPLKLLSFNASLKNNNVSVNWSTDEEQQVNLFYIERSNDGVNFSTIVTENANNNNSVNHYTYTDKTNFAGITYYRVKWSNNDGSFNYSGIQSVKNQTFAASVSAYPNPFTSSLTIAFPASYQGKAVKTEVYNNGGQLVKTISMTAGASLNLNGENLQRGIYTIRVISAENISSMRVIKN